MQRRLQEAEDVATRNGRQCGGSLVECAESMPSVLAALVPLLCALILADAALGGEIDGDTIRLGFGFIPASCSNWILEPLQELVVDVVDVLPEAPWTMHSITSAIPIPFWSTET